MRFKLPKIKIKLESLKSIFIDLMILTGFSGVVYGAYEMHQPSSFIVGGLMILWAFLPKTNKKAD